MLATSYPPKVSTRRFNPGWPKQVQERLHFRFVDQVVWNNQVVTLLFKRNEPQTQGHCGSLYADAGVGLSQKPTASATARWPLTSR